MKLRRIAVEDFGVVGGATLELGEGLNVFYGPNDLGKSTLVSATRLALLLPYGFKDAQQYSPWGHDAVPRVRLEFQHDDGRHYRIDKRFDRSHRGGAELDSSNDGQTWTNIATARDVDGQLRELLGWGIASPGGKGGPKGLPLSFLARALLGEQAEVDAILNQTLAEDSHESGRARLTAALDAFAQDPLFKEVLSAAQARVTAAFKSNGNPRVGQSAPLRIVGDEVKRAKQRVDDARRELEESESATREAKAAIARVAETTEARDLAARTLRLAESNLARAAAWSDAQAASESAERALAAATARLAERAEKRSAKERADAALVLAEGRARQADEGVRETRELLEAAAERARASQTDGEAQKRSAELELERRIDRARRDEAIAEISERLAAAEEEVQTLEASADRAGEEQNEARRVALHLDGAWALAERWRAEEALEALRARQAEAASLRDDAARRRAEAQSDRDLPASLTSLDAVRPMEALAQSLAVAEARLDVGLRVAIERSPGTEFEVLEGARDAESVTADRRIALTLTLATGDPVATLRIEGGSADAHAEVTALRERFTSEVAPALEEAGVEDLMALRQAVEAHRERQARKEEAERLEERARGVDPRPDELAALRERIAAAEIGDARTLEADARSPELAARREEANARLSRAGDAVQEAIARVARARASADAARAERERAGDPSDEAESTSRLTSALAELRSAGGAERLAAEAAHDEARSGLAAARRAADEAGEALQQAHARASEAAGGLVAAERDANDLDLPTLESQRDACLQAASALTPPDAPLDTESARAALEAAEGELEAARHAMHRHQGRVESSGGNVARERHTQAREALTIAEQEERRVRTDLEAWRLLAEALRAAEDDEGKHLGDALASTVTARFDALMNAHGDATRYGGLSLDPNLAAVGVVAGGELQPVQALSVGTREQLALLVRLTIAEALGAPLLLDDLLTHTDPGRAAWFRQTLRLAAQKTQVVVITCRPDVYLDDADLPAHDGPPFRDRAAGLVRAIDASRIIRHHGE